MTESEIRLEILEIAADYAMLDFSYIPSNELLWLITGDLVEVYKGVKETVTVDGNDDYSDKLEEIEKALRDLWLIA